MKLDQLINQAPPAPPSVTRLLSVGLTSTGSTNSGNASLLPPHHTNFNYYPKTAATSNVLTQRVNLPPISDILQQAQHYLPPPPQQQQQQSQSVSSYRQNQTQLPPLPLATSNSINTTSNYKYYDYYQSSNSEHQQHSYTSSSTLPSPRIPHSDSTFPPHQPHQQPMMYRNNSYPPVQQQQQQQQQPGQPQYHHQQQQQYVGVGGDSYFRNRTPQPPVINHNHNTNNSGFNSTSSSSSISSPLSSPYDSQNRTNDSTATGTPSNDFMKHSSGVRNGSTNTTNGGVNNNRKTRNNLPKEITYILLRWLNDHLNHPYPSSFEKNQLMISTGLNQQQLSNWFINARRRKIKLLKQQQRLNF